MILGQEKIINFIDNSSLDTWPRVVIINGPTGSGRHEIAKYISNHLGLEILDVTEWLKKSGVAKSEKCVDDLDKEVLSPIPKIFLVDKFTLNFGTYTGQNLLLKYLEEPTLFSFFIIITDNIDTVLDTIKNRSHILNLEPYNYDTLSKFVSGKDSESLKTLFEIARTPGDVIKLNDTDLIDMKNQVSNMISKIGIANVGSIFKIADKINFGDEPEKYDLRLFILETLNQLRNMIFENFNRRIFDAWYLTKDLQKDLLVLVNPAKKDLFNEYLLNFKNIMTREYEDREI